MFISPGNVTKTKDEHLIAHALVADITGSVQLSIWDTDADYLRPSDIIRLKGGYCTLFRRQMILYAGKHGTIEKIGE